MYLQIYLYIVPIKTKVNNDFQLILYTYRLCEVNL